MTKIKLRDKTRDNSIDEIARKFPSIGSLFQKIAEPRIVRIILFGVYIAFAVSGFGLMAELPESFEYVVGIWLLRVFAIFIALGGLLCATAVLPGIWWLERVGLILLGSGLGMYLVIISSLNTSVFLVAVTIALMLKFVRRFVEIKNAQLSPGDDR